MKPIVILTILLCSACATNNEASKGDDYKPPQYRTGSHLPWQGGSRVPDAYDGKSFQQALPPKMTPKPTDS
jgi:hypothetical protein